MRAVEFLDTLLGMPQRPDRNLVTFLLGEVGSGKTTLLNYIISREIRKYVETGKLLVFRIDIEDESDSDHAPTFWSLIALLHRKVTHVLQKLPSVRTLNPDVIAAYEKVAAQTDAGLLSDIEAANTAYHNLVNLFACLRRTGVKILLILDNIDYLCHLNDESIFSDFSDTDEVHYISGFCSFVRDLAGNSDLVRLGLHVLVVSRHDTYQTLVETRHTSLLNMFRGHSNGVYTAIRPEETVILNAIVDLLDYVSKKAAFSAGEQRQIREIKIFLEEDLAAEPQNQLKFVKHMVRITKYGFRDISAFFDNYIWRATETDPPAIERGLVKRYLHTYPVGIITYMLGGHVLFHQFTSEFCNIYLVNVQEDRCVNGLNPEHRHTYWLKRLILQLTAAREFDSPAEIYEIFHQEGRGYEEVAIKACLNSLGDANCSAMLSYFRKAALHKPSSREVLQVERIKASERGRHCLDHIFDRFFYLQLVVDDRLLPFPKALREYFRIPPDLDYRYVTASASRVYFEGAKRMIGYKFRKVLVFLNVLEASLEWEMGIYPDVFQTLGDDFGIVAPDIATIREKVVQEVRHLNHAFDGGVINVDREFEELDSIRGRVATAVDSIYSSHIAG